MQPLVHQKPFVYCTAIRSMFYTQTLVCILSILLFSLHFLRCWQQEFVLQTRVSCDLHTEMNLSLIIFSVLHVDVAVVVPGGDFHKVYLKPTQTAAIKKKCKLLLFCEPFTPQYQYAYSPYCSLYISLGADKESLFYKQEFHKLVIISLFLWL